VLAVASAQGAAEVALSTAASPAFYVALVLYGVSALLFVSAFIDAPRWLSRAALLTMALGFVAHGVDIGWRGVEGVHPGTSVREALGFSSWLVAGGYLFWSLRVKLEVLGAFIAPGTLVTLAAARLSPTGEAMPGLSVLGRIHISLATLGVAIFSLASLIAVVYLVQERSLKKKNFDGVLFNNSSALETLDRLSHRLVLFGFPIFTAAIMLGVVWGAQRGIDLTRPEHPLALIAWAAFAALVVARATRGWRGRRAALLTLVGFAGAVIVMVIYFLRRAVL
jgi:ABC-type uncharacterized transport system permease subunit